MKLTVDVTAKDIRLGAPGDSASCPIALALQRLPNVVDWEVDGECVHVVIDSVEYGAYLDDDTAKRVADYDSTEEMTPFSFEVELSPVVNDKYDEYKSDEDR